MFKRSCHLVPCMPIYGSSRRPTFLSRGVLPYMGYIGMCGPKGYGFSAVFGHKLGIDFSHFAVILVINRVSIFAL